MKSVQDNCGMFGMYSDDELVYDIYHGIDFLQHRGQEYCGIATCNSQGNIRQVTHHGKVGGSFIVEDLAPIIGKYVD